jgi:hypothetical protein
MIEVMGGAGFDVQVGMADAPHDVEAVDRETGETFVVRGDDLYRTVVGVAQQLEIKLEDG